MNKQPKNWIIRDNKTGLFLGQDELWYELPSKCLHPACFIKQYTAAGKTRYFNTLTDCDLTAMTIEHGNKQYNLGWLM
jgi:hypothetical protein